MTEKVSVTLVIDKSQLSSLKAMIERTIERELGSMTGVKMSTAEMFAFLENVDVFKKAIDQIDDRLDGWR
jgi:hypothetical protein